MSAFPGILRVLSDGTCTLPFSWFISSLAIVVTLWVALEFIVRRAVTLALWLRRQVGPSMLGFCARIRAVEDDLLGTSAEFPSRTLFEALGDLTVYGLFFAYITLYYLIAVALAIAKNASNNWHPTQFLGFVLLLGSMSFLGRICYVRARRAWARLRTTA